MQHRRLEVIGLVEAGESSGVGVGARRTLRATPVVTRHVDDGPPRIGERVVQTRPALIDADERLLDGVLCASAISADHEREADQSCAVRGGERLKARALAPREVHRSLLLSVELISFLLGWDPGRLSAARFTPIQTCGHRERLGPPAKSDGLKTEVRSTEWIPAGVWRVGYNSTY